MGLKFKHGNTACNPYTESLQAISRIRKAETGRKPEENVEQKNKNQRTLTT